MTAVQEVFTQFMHLNSCPASRVTTIPAEQLADLQTSWKALRDIYTGMCIKSRQALKSQGLTLEDILRDDSLLAMFTDFATAKLGETVGKRALDFFAQVSKFKSSTNAEFLVQQATLLCEKYVYCDASLPPAQQLFTAAIIGNIRNAMEAQESEFDPLLGVEIRRKTKIPSPSTFDEAQKAVLEKLRSEVYPAFMQQQEQQQGQEDKRDSLVGEAGSEKKAAK